MRPAGIKWDEQPLGIETDSAIAERRDARCAGGREQRGYHGEVSALWGWAAQMRRMAESRREDAARLSHPHGHDLVLGVRPNENGAELR